MPEKHQRTQEICPKLEGSRSNKRIQKDDGHFVVPNAIRITAPFEAPSRVLACGRSLRTARDVVEFRCGLCKMGYKYIYMDLYNPKGIAQNMVVFDCEMYSRQDVAVGSTKHGEP